jgi:hypothetical protein
MYGTRIWASAKSASQILGRSTSVLVISQIYNHACIKDKFLQPGEICNFHLKRDRSMVQPTDCLSRGAGHLEIAQSRDEQVEFKVCFLWPVSYHPLRSPTIIQIKTILVFPPEGFTGYIKYIDAVDVHLMGQSYSQLFHFG